MSEPRLISPLLDGFAMGGPISSHNGVCCCPAMRENSDDKYIVKIISIPASQVQVDALLLSGAYRDRDSVLAYFKRMAEGTAREAEILKQLSKLEGFTPYERWQIVPMENGVGYDLYLVGSYKRPLSRHMEKHPMTHLGAVNLGLDMCAALAVCRRTGNLYVDLKPENIYVFDEQTYRIGDLGFIPLSSLKYASLPEKYRSSYTAPEIADAYSTLNTTIDIYALGLVLYRIYNDGKLPFEGTAPAEAFPAPAYADYEMSEIILKACAPNPADRWQDPMEMGQALIDYMQRNGVNATPIVPLPVQPAEPEAAPAEDAPAQENPVQEPAADESADDCEAAAEAAPEDIPAEAPPVQEAPAVEADAAPAAEESEAAQEAPAEAAPEQPEAAPESEEDDIGDLSFMDDMSADETAPSEESAIDLDGAVLSDETSAILAQADALIAHEPPAPAVAPGPIDVPIPDPIISESEEAEEAPAAEEAQEALPEDVPAEEADAVEEAPIKPRKRKGWLVALLILALLAGLTFGGYYYYENYYLQTVEGFTAHYADEFIHVTILSQIPDEELIVYCTDTYGNSQKSEVTDGKASFTDLKPSTQYTLTVESLGFHKLVGMTETSYTTLAQTNIAAFSAKTGAEDGSVILTYTVDGSEPATGWTVGCSAAGEETRVFTTMDHWISINGLTPGTEYTFTLSAAEDIRIVGTTELTYTATNVILAQNPAIVSCEDGILTAQWNAPEGAEVAAWSVRCYDNAGYDQTFEVTEPSAVFTGVDNTKEIFVDITAAGQTQSAQVSITAEPRTVISTLAEPGTDVLKLQWTYDGSEPEGGWIVSYSVGGGASQEITVQDSSASLSPLIPGCQYTISIRTADEKTVFNNTLVCDLPAAEDFDRYKIDRGDMTFKMLKRPGKENWTYRDVLRGPFTTTFTAGDKASFLIVLAHWQEKSRDEISILYVVKDENGVPVSAETQSMVWNNMWDNGYCELNIPAIPATPGSYKLEVYFNLDLASVTNFTVQ